MILTLIIFFDYGLLWFARKNLGGPRNLEIHLGTTALLILANSIFLFTRSNRFRKAEQSFYAVSSRTLNPIARFVLSNSLPIFVLVLASGVIVRLNMISTYPIDYRSADMLPIIKSAITAFLSGDNPYQVYNLPGPVPLGYFPLLWMSYIPAVVLRLDLRIVGLIICTAIFFVFWNESRRLKGTIGSKPLEALLAFFLGIVFFLSPYLIFFTATGHPYPYWLFLTFFLYFLQNDRLTLAAVFLGLAISTRQPATILVPFFLIYLFKNFPRRECFRCLLLLILSSAFLVLPFLLADPKAFLLNPFHYVQPEWSGSRAAILGSVGLTNIFYYLGISRFLPLVQAVALILFSWLALFKVRDKVSLFVYSGLAVFLYNSFLFYIPSHYFYIPALIILSFAAMVNLLRTEPVTSPPPLAVKKFLGSMSVTIAPVFMLFLFFADVRGLLTHDQIVLRRGFHETEKNNEGFTFNWVVGHVGVAAIPASVTDIIFGRNRVVSFEAVPFHYPNGPPQDMEILVNDQELTTIRMKSAWKRYHLSIPAKFFNVGCNKIEFYFTYAASPSQFRDTKDRRQLAAAFHFLK